MAGANISYHSDTVAKKPDPRQVQGGEASGQKDNDDVAYPVGKPRKTGYQMDKDEADKKKMADQAARWERKAEDPDGPDSEAEVWS